MLRFIDLFHEVDGLFLLWPSLEVLNSLRMQSSELELPNEDTLNYGAIFRPFGVIILKYLFILPNTASSNRYVPNSMRIWAIALTSKDWIKILQKN